MASITAAFIPTGESVQGGRGSVYWNEFCRRWVMIVSAKPGEIWFAEGGTPAGPWVYARRVGAHDNYNFYNPTQHPFFDQESGRLIYFEGTYTAAFSGAREKTPRYDYNQIADGRLQIAEPAGPRCATGPVPTTDSAVRPGIWRRA